MATAAAEITPAPSWVPPTVATGDAPITLRRAAAEDVEAIHQLVTDHVASDHLLPRTRDEIADRVTRFLVVAAGDEVVGCAELAPLSAEVAEVRSLVVADHARGIGAGRLLLHALVREAHEGGHLRLCAFTHKPAYFIRLGFSIVPHLFVREKVFTDCVGCPLFRRCGQHAVVLSLSEVTGMAAAQERVA